MTTDQELLRQFARTNSQDAFAELVKRHVNLVYSAALRQMNGDEHLAKDVAQMVFTDLARKAGSLARRETLTGWLYTSAHFAAAKIIRGENRRRDREEKFMREPTNETAPEPDWEKIRPTLDDAMHELKEADREAILLRYFENRQFAEVGAKLGLNENAARMRVERALEKLRDIFTRRGITTATALASVVSANAVQIAPANLAVTLTTASIATAGTGTFTLLKIMTMTKIKLGISALVVAGAATAFVIQHQAQEKLRAENESLTQQIGQLQTDNANFSNRLASTGDSKKLPDDQFNELLKLRGEVGVLRNQTTEIGKLREENRQLQISMTKPKFIDPNTGQFITKEQSDVMNTNRMFSRTFRIVDIGAFFQNLKRSFPANDGESNPQTLLRFFKQNGVTFDPPASLFIANDTNQMILVRNTLTNLATIEKFIAVVNSNQ
jgi:RNA polymerase sigma factor (sigma-70 family)